MFIDDGDYLRIELFLFLYFKIFNLELLLGLLKDLYILFWLSITWSWMDYYLAWWAGHFGMLWSSSIHMPLDFRFKGLSLYFILFFNLFYFLTCNNNEFFYSQFRKEIKISLSLKKTPRTKRIILFMNHARQWSSRSLNQKIALMNYWKVLERDEIQSSPI